MGGTILYWIRLVTEITQLICYFITKLTLVVKFHKIKNWNGDGHQKQDRVIIKNTNLQTNFIKVDKSKILKCCKFDKTLHPLNIPKKSNKNGRTLFHRYVILKIINIMTGGLSCHDCFYFKYHLWKSHRNPMLIFDVRNSKSQESKAV